VIVAVEEAGALRLTEAGALRLTEAGALRLGVSVAVAVDPLLRVTDALPVSVAEEVAL